jgi:hypothetical protein
VLGHRDIRSTLGYTEVQDAKVRAALERAAPQYTAFDLGKTPTRHGEPRIPTDRVSGELPAQDFGIASALPAGG